MLSFQKERMIVPPPSITLFGTHPDGHLPALHLAPCHINPTCPCMCAHVSFFFSGLLGGGGGGGVRHVACTESEATNFSELERSHKERD